MNSPKRRSDLIIVLLRLWFSTTCQPLIGQLVYAYYFHNHSLYCFHSQTVNSPQWVSQLISIPSHFSDFMLLETNPTLGMGHCLTRIVSSRKQIWFLCSQWPENSRCRQPEGLWESYTKLIVYDLSNYLDLYWQYLKLLEISPKKSVFGRRTDRQHHNIIYLISVWNTFN